MENERLFGLLCYVQRVLNRKNDSILSSEGVTDVSGVQLHALVAVAKSGKDGRKLCQKDLEKELALRPSSVSSMLAKLERDGFIIRVQVAGDARSKFIALTEKGDAVCKRHKHVMDGCDEAVQNCLTEEECRTLKALLIKIIDSVSE